MKFLFKPPFIVQLHWGARVLATKQVAQSYGWYLQVLQVVELQIYSL